MHTQGGWIAASLYQRRQIAETRAQAGLAVCSSVRRRGGRMRGGVTVEAGLKVLRGFSSLGCLPGGVC